MDNIKEVTSGNMSYNRDTNDSSEITSDIGDTNVYIGNIKGVIISRNMSYRR